MHKEKLLLMFVNNLLTHRHGFGGDEESELCACSIPLFGQRK